jgi:hypothetical protein
MLVMGSHGFGTHIQYLCFRLGNDPLHCLVSGTIFLYSCTTIAIAYALALWMAMMGFEFISNILIQNKNGQMGE